MRAMMVKYRVIRAPGKRFPGGAERLWNMLRREILPGVFLTAEQTDKYKTALLSLSLLRPLESGTASLGALLPSVLLRGTESCPDMERISEFLDGLYGAGFSGAVRKKGETQAIGFFADFIDDALAPGGEPILAEMTRFLGEVLLHPHLEDGVFSEDYVESEKLNLINSIESQINDKRAYATRRLIAEMCRGEGYGVDRLGSVESAEAISPETLTAYYHKALASSRYELFYCGRADFDTVAQLLRDALSGLPERAPDEIACVPGKAPDTPRRVSERMDVTQAKLAIGLRTGITAESGLYPAMVLLNTVYGGGVSSKLFNNVREKLSLCYYASSAVEKYKGVMVIASGVETADLPRAEREILRQLEDCKNAIITEDELESARRYALSSLRVGLDSPGRLEDFALGQAIAGLTETMEDLAERLRTVTRHDVAAAARTLTLDTVFTLEGERA